MMNLKARKLYSKENFLVKEIVWEFFFLQTILIFEQPILFDSFNVRFWKCRKYRPIFVPFVFPRDPRTLVAWCVDKIEQQSTILVCNDKKSFSCQWRLTQKKVKGQDKKSLARQVVYWWNTNTFLGKNKVDF